MSNHSRERVNYPARSEAPELPFSLTCTHALTHMFARCGWQASRSATAAAQPAAGASSRGPILAEPSDTFDPEKDSVVDEEEGLSVVHSASGDDGSSESSDGSWHQPLAARGRGRGRGKGRGAAAARGRGRRGRGAAPAAAAAAAKAAPARGSILHGSTLSRRLLAEPARCARPSAETRCVAAPTLAGPRVAAAAQAKRRQQSRAEWPRHGGRVRGGQPSMADRRGLGRACPCVAGCGSSTTGTAWALHGSAARARSTGTAVAASAVCAVRRARCAWRRDVACTRMSTSTIQVLC